MFECGSTRRRGSRHNDTSESIREVLVWAVLRGNAAQLAAITFACGSPVDCAEPDLLMDDGSKVRA